MSEVPAGWATTTLGELVTEVRPKASPKDHADLPFVGMDQILPNDMTLLGTEKFGTMKSNGGLFFDGDVLYGRMRPYLNKVHRARFAGACSAEFIVFPQNDALDSDFLAYLLHDRRFVCFAASLSSGDRPRVDLADISPYSFLLPPRAEQTRIASRLNEFFSRIEDGDRVFERVQPLMHRYRQSVLRAAVTGELTREWRAKNTGKLESGETLLARILTTRREAWEKAKLKKKKANRFPANDKSRRKYEEPAAPNTSELPVLPDGWVWSSLGQLFRVSIGSTPSRKVPEYWNGAIPWVSSGEVAFCRIAKTNESISHLGYQNSSVRMHAKGTVLLAMIGEGRTRGQAAILDIEACHNQNAASIGVAETPIPSEYVYYFLQFRYESVRSIGQGGNQPALNGELVKGIAIPVPPLEEMFAICDAIGRHLGVIAKLESELEVLEQLSRAQRQVILREALAGHLTTQNPADEPASKLLERIAAQRGSTPARGRHRRRKLSG